MFIEGDQAAQAERGDLFEQEGVGWPVAAESFIGDQGGGYLPGFEFFAGLAVHQGLGLSEEVGQQLDMMVANGVMADRRGDKVAGDKNGALVDQLVEGMLAIGAGFAPDNRAGGPGDGVAVAIDALPIAFHISLLEIGGKAVHILVIGQNSFGLGAEEIGVP